MKIDGYIILPRRPLLRENPKRTSWQKYRQDFSEGIGIVTTRGACPNKAYTLLNSKEITIDLLGFIKRASEIAKSYHAYYTVVLLEDSIESFLISWRDKYKLPIRIWSEKEIPLHEKVDQNLKKSLAIQKHLVENLGYKMKIEEHLNKREDIRNGLGGKNELLIIYLENPVDPTNNKEKRIPYSLSTPLTITIKDHRDTIQYKIEKMSIPGLEWLALVLSTLEITDEMLEWRDVRSSSEEVAEKIYQYLESR